MQITQPYGRRRIACALVSTFVAVVAFPAGRRARGPAKGLHAARQSLRFRLSAGSAV
jgi:hypothetical protein